MRSWDRLFLSVIADFCKLFFVFLNLCIKKYIMLNVIVTIILDISEVFRLFILKFINAFQAIMNLKINIGGIIWIKKLLSYIPT